jgi:hypothetical protein
MKRYLLLFLSGLMVFSSNTRAGKLDDFEESATKKSACDSKDPDCDKGHKDRRDDKDDDGEDGDRGVAEFLAELFVNVFAVGGMTSWKRVQAVDPDPWLSSIGPRQLGEVTIPFLRLDAVYQNIESDVDAMDYRAEVGYGPLAVHYNLTHLDEYDPDDTLVLHRLYGIYRMSFGSRFEWDIGAGILTIDGDDRNTGYSFTMPLLAKFNGWLGAEFRPAWSVVNDNNINEYDLSLLLGKRYAGVKVGYRWISAGAESLNGPYAGLSLRI